MLVWSAKQFLAQLRRLKVYDEVEAICLRHGIVDVVTVYERSKRLNICEGRAEVMMFLRERFGWSYPTVADFFGRDHTTAIAGCRRALKARNTRGPSPRPPPPRTNVA